MIKKILIPVYNDWSSLKTLLNKLEYSLKPGKYEILIVNDFSNTREKFNLKNFKKIKKLKILNLDKNVGSQNCILIGLHYLSKIKKSFIVSVMDGDGEDDPNHVNKLFEKAEKNQNLVVTSNRLNRNEGKLFQSLYKLHLFFTFLFTFKWIDFGNFSSFNSNNIPKILKQGEIALAFSAGISKCCRLYRCPSDRKKRYKGKSKVTYTGLFLHSLRILSVFDKRVLITSSLYSLLITIGFQKLNITIFILILFIFFNLILSVIRIKFKLPKNKKDIYKIIKNTNIYHGK